MLALALLIAAMPSNETAVRVQARAFDAARVAKEGKTLDRSLADDLVFVRGSGKLAGKKDFIEAFTDPAVTFEPITIVKPTYVQLGPDAGIVGGETTIRGTDDGQSFAEHIRYADTFHRISGQRKVVHVQVTMVR